ncbi:MAG: hypothetical protein A3F68_06210 [Acidobacteria bacterium RIFCSPLOWO2_12_FULL_54_10]|nr:MAG: hypothetical protein A3F68_06210 [Acidobacteria bacterium RIFCSPLOWO2_12_FULL_54_10]
MWKWISESFRQETYMGYLAIARLMMSIQFFEAGIGKLSGGFVNGDQLLRQLSESVAGDPIALHRAFIESVVIPNTVFFSYLVAYGELAIALSLLTGTLVRVACTFGAFHNLNIFLAIAWANGGPQMRLNRIFIALHIVFVLASAGRSLGVDGWLKKKFPSCWLF